MEETPKVGWFDKRVSLPRSKIIIIVCLIVMILSVLVCGGLFLECEYIKNEFHEKYETELPNPDNMLSVEKSLDYYAKKFDYYIAFKSDNIYERHLIYERKCDKGSYELNESDMKFSHYVNQIFTNFKSSLPEASGYTAITYEMKYDISNGKVVVDVTVMNMY